MSSEPSSPRAPVPGAVPAAAHAAAAARRAAAYPAADPRLAPLRADLARRLGPVLRAAGVDTPAATFDALVLDMARVALHWALADAARRAPTPRTGQPAVPGSLA